MVWVVKKSMSSPTSNMPVSTGRPALESLMGGPAMAMPQPVKAQFSMVMRFAPAIHAPQEDVRHASSMSANSQFSTRTSSAITQRPERRKSTRTPFNSMPGAASSSPATCCGGMMTGSSPSAARITTDFSTRMGNVSRVSSYTPPARISSSPSCAASSASVMLA